MTDTTRDTPKADFLGVTTNASAEDLGNPLWWWQVAAEYERKWCEFGKLRADYAIVASEAICEAERLCEIDHQMWSEHVEDQEAVHNFVTGG